MVALLITTPEITIPPVAVSEVTGMACNTTFDGQMTYYAKLAFAYLNKETKYWLVWSAGKHVLLLSKCGRQQTWHHRFVGNWRNNSPQWEIVPMQLASNKEDIGCRWKHISRTVRHFFNSVRWMSSSINLVSRSYMHLASPPYFQENWEQLVYDIFSTSFMFSMLWKSKHFYTEAMQLLQ